MFILVISDRFTKLTKAVTLRHNTAYDVAVAFAEDWAFKYGPPDILLSENGPELLCTSSNAFAMSSK